MHEYLPFVKTTEGPNETFEQEVARGFSNYTVFVNDDINVFDWWATNHTHFRRIALAAKYFLAITGGSVPRDIAFSTAETLVTLF